MQLMQETYYKIFQVIYMFKVVIKIIFVLDYWDSPFKWD